MREFFRGWKRKAGVATLVMACVLTTLWARSESGVGDVYIPYDKSTLKIGYISHRGRLTYFCRRQRLIREDLTFEWKEEVIWSFEYRIAVIPLALLSAYLLLSKPRQRSNQTDDARNP